MTYYYFCRLKFESDMCFFGNNPLLPIYSRSTTGYMFEQLVKILMTDVDEQLLCKIRPTGVSQNASFVVDLDHVKFGDIKSDDIGSWKGTGVIKFWGPRNYGDPPSPKC